MNKPFKSALKEKHVDYCIDNGANNLKVSLTKMNEMICETWYNDTIITSEMIYYSFSLIWKKIINLMII